MAVSKIYSAQTTHLSAQIIDIEVDLSKGLHSFNLVGLGDTSVNESKDRVSAAIKNSGFKSPKMKNQKVVVSLAPADIKKEGPLFDLPIAVAYLIASEDIKAEIEDKIFVGELSLDGELRPIKGALPIAQKAKQEGFTEIFLPKENAEEASCIEGIKVFGAGTLMEVLQHVNIKKQKEGNGKNSDGKNFDEKEEQNKPKIPHVEIKPHKRAENLAGQKQREIDVDFADIKGQESAKRGLLIAAAGGHNIIMYGPPGTGKTMLARAFRHILPPLSFEEMLEVTSIYSIGDTLTDGLIFLPPFRSPHHTASYVALVGGGANLKPGEITLAHKGVLFMDELPEFDARVLETLRQPLEDREVTVSRAKGSVRYPANFTLVATMNPCSCGNYGVKGKECTCSAQQIERYKRKLSGPIVDRIDLWLEVSKIEHEKLTNKREFSETEVMREQVAQARERQSKRYAEKGLKIKTNAELSAKELISHIALTDEVKNLLNTSAKQLDLSARVYHRLKPSPTWIVSQISLKVIS